MPRFAANLTTMFNEVAFPLRFEAAAKAGFTAVEFLFPYDFATADVAGWLAGNGLRSVLFNMPPGDWAAGERGIASLPGRERQFQRRRGPRPPIRGRARHALHPRHGRTPARRRRPRAAPRRVRR